LRKLDGTIIRILRFRSAQRWEMTIPASIVFPSPTSSASFSTLSEGQRFVSSCA
jgi:hypothetical protein